MQRQLTNMKMTTKDENNVTLIFSSLRRRRHGPSLVHSEWLSIYAISPRQGEPDDCENVFFHFLLVFISHFVRTQSLCGPLCSAVVAIVCLFIAFSNWNNKYIINLRARAKEKCLRMGGVGSSILSFLCVAISGVRRCHDVHENPCRLLFIYAWLVKAAAKIAVERTGPAKTLR